LRKVVYAVLGVAVLAVAGIMIVKALNNSLVYFVLPNEYARDPQGFAGRRIRLGGLVEPGTVKFNSQTLTLTFTITDSIKSYPVVYKGAPPDLFKPDQGLVVDGRFKNGTFVGDQLLVKHSSNYRPPKPGQPIDVNMLKKTLQ